MSAPNTHTRYGQHMGSWSAICLLCHLSMAATAVAQEVVLTDEIQKALRHNADALVPITVEWELRRHGSRDIEELVKDLGTKRYDFYRPEHGMCALDGSMFFITHTFERNLQPADANKDRFERVTATSSFDGDAYYRLQDVPMRTCDVSTLDKMKSTNIRVEVLSRLGFHVRLGKAPQPDIIWHLEHGGSVLSVSSATVDGADCAVVRIIPERWHFPYWRDRQYIYYLDIGKNYAPRKIEWKLPDGRLLCTVKNSDWHKLESPQMWLPKKSSCEWHTWDHCPDRSFDDVFFYEDFAITKVSREKWPHTKFSPDLSEPEMMVSDPRPEAKNKPGATFNQSSSKWDYSNTPPLPEMPRRNAGPWRTLLIAGNIVLFLLVGVAVWRKRSGPRNG